MKHKHPGILIAIDGIDGSGKTTQVALLAEALSAAGEDVVVSKEPTDGAWGRLIRESARTKRMALGEELAAFLEDRKEHLEGLIIPSLKANRIVVLDRYYYSTIAYQGTRGMDPGELLGRMHREAILPDQTFILDVPAAVGVDRISRLRGERPNLFEEIGDLEVAREIYSGIAEDNLVHVDSAGPVEVVQRRLRELLFEGALKAKRCAKSYGCSDWVHCSYRMTEACRWWKVGESLGVGADLSTLSA